MKLNVPEKEHLRMLFRKAIKMLRTEQADALSYHQDNRFDSLGDDIKTTKELYRTMFGEPM